MKKLILFTATGLLTVVSLSGFAQSGSSGVVNYEIIIQRNNPNGGQSMNSNDANGGDAPNTFTIERTFTFNSTGGKLSSPSFGGGRNGNFARRGSNEEYVDFANKKYIRAFKRDGNDTTFYISQDIKTAANFQPSDKTKRIAGYICYQATAQMRNNTFTIWYTKDIPENFSPVDGLVPPDGGFVLALESDRMEYRATKVSLRDVSNNEIQIQGISRQLSPDEIREMRRRMFQERSRNGGSNQ